MKSLLHALVLSAVILTGLSVHAVTLTTVTNPPTRGTVSGAGTYAPGAQVSADMNAVSGWYIGGVDINPPKVNLNEFQKIQALYGLSGSDATTIASFSEPLTLNTNTTIAVTFASAASAISQQPTNQISIAEATVTMTAGASGRRPLSYRWQNNGQFVAGAASLNLVLNSVQTTNSGAYTLVVSNIFGAVTSTPAMLLVKDFIVYANGAPMTNSSIMVGGSVVISLQSRYANGSVFYTLDGTEPDFNATPYSGPFTVSSTCTLRAIGYRSDFLQAVFADTLNIGIVPVYNLSAQTTGGGTITLDPPGAFYASNTTVTVTASPSPGWTFMGWSGAMSGSSPTNTIILRANSYVQAVFGTTLATTTAGNGTVSVYPAFPLYPYGSVVQFTATPNLSNYFGLWGNAASGSQNPLSFFVNTPNATISALFAALPTNQAALTVLSDGGGFVGVMPFANKYQIGSTNTLTAYADIRQQFLGWSGDASGNQNPLSLVMDTSKTITAHFSRVPSLGISLSGGGPVQLWINGVSGDVWRIEASTNLSNWSPLATLTNFFYSLQFADPDSTNFQQRMYRAVVP